MSAEGYFLIAHAVNAISSDRARVEWEVASETTDGRWVTNEGMEVYPFYTQPITTPTPAIPEGWIEHIHTLADASRPPPISLAEALGIRPAPSAPIVRRF